MKDLNVIVYTMEGCPFCTDFKEMLTKEGIEFFDRDIDKYKKEYDTFACLYNTYTEPIAWCGCLARAGAHCRVTVCHMVTASGHR